MSANSKGGGGVQTLAALRMEVFFYVPPKYDYFNFFYFLYYFLLPIPVKVVFSLDKRVGIT